MRDHEGTVNTPGNPSEADITLSIDSLLENGYRLYEADDKSPSHALESSQLLNATYQWTHAEVSKGESLWLIDSGRETIVHFNNVSCGADDRGSNATRQILENLGFDSPENPVESVAQLFGSMVCKFSRVVIDPQAKEATS